MGPLNNLQGVPGEFKFLARPLGGHAGTMDTPHIGLCYWVILYIQEVLTYFI